MTEKEPECLRCGGIEVDCACPEPCWSPFERIEELEASVESLTRLGCDQIERLQSQLNSLRDALKHIHFLMGDEDIPEGIREEVCAYIDGKL